MTSHVTLFAYAAAIAVILRAAGGLIFHGLRRPGSAATLSRGSGQVAAR